jgi:hypothetical protein
MVLARSAATRRRATGVTPALDPDVRDRARVRVAISVARDATHAFAVHADDSLERVFDNRIEKD